jgi:hypothetical protein
MWWHARHILIDIDRQTLGLYQGARRLGEYRVSTGLKGVGELNGSGCTPRGLHRVRIGIGEGCPLGTVFRGRRATGEVYDSVLAAAHPGRDWILTRILWLTGCESGRNRGGAVDTLRRFIYIHGSPDTEPMGIPCSHGCIRMHGPELIELFEGTPVGTHVLLLGSDQSPDRTSDPRARSDRADDHVWIGAGLLRGVESAPSSTRSVGRDLLHDLRKGQVLDRAETRDGGEQKCAHVRNGVAGRLLRVQGDGDAPQPADLQPHRLRMRERALQLVGLERESGLPAQEVKHGDTGPLSLVGAAMHTFALGDAEGFGLRAGALTGQDTFLEGAVALVDGTIDSTKGIAVQVTVNSRSPSES